MTFVNGVPKFGRYHDPAEMLNVGLRALKDAKYEKRYQSGMFDDMEQEDDEING